MKFNQILDNLNLYEAGKPIELVVREFGVKPEEIIKLASNENPLGVSKNVAQILQEQAKFANLYPDDSFYELKDALASKFGVNQKNIIIGSGSDQVIEFLIRAKSNEKNGILMAGITFAMYEIYAGQTGAKIYKTKSQTHDLEQFKELYLKHKDEIKIIFLCMPNNPLGECLDASEIYQFMELVDKDCLIVIDGAYQDFASFKDKNKEIKPAYLISKFPNSIYLGTFSKSYGLGGMRVGYGIANDEIIANLHKLRPPFNITTLSLKASIAALKDSEFIKQTLENNFAQMQEYENFAKNNNIEFIKSYTNFITFLVKNSSEISQNLLKKGIIIRNLKSYGINAIRITIGTKEQNERVLNELKKEI